MADLAKKIRALRNRLGLTQAEFGERVGVNQSTVARWESGAEVGGDKLPALAKLAGQSIDQFVNDDQARATVPDAPQKDFDLLAALDAIGEADPNERRHLEEMIRKLAALARGQLGRDG